jgi:murein DD-endopeptidase MepM/ murein hydrolase activator NlpD
LDKRVFLIPDRLRTCWQGFFGADLAAKAGIYGLSAGFSTEGFDQTFNVEVVKRDHGVRRLTLPKKMVDLDAATLERVRAESRIMEGLWQAPGTRPLWSGAFLRPVPGPVAGPFGRRSVINGRPKSPHSGVDLKAPRGTPVKAANNGRVVLTAEHFFSGKSVVIDHGGGVLSMYFHLQEVLVEDERGVDKGEIIGLVGATGRSTGPHLHWGVRMNGARVNPMQLLALSGELEEP